MSLLDQIESLVAQLRRQGLTSLDWHEGQEHIRLRLQIEPPLINPSAPAPLTTSVVTSPEMGIFRAHPLESDRRVTPGDVVGYVELGALRLAIVAPVSGTLSLPCVNDGCELGYGEQVFEILSD